MGCLWVWLRQCEENRGVWKTRGMYVYRFLCRRRKETKRLEVDDFVYAVCCVCIVSTWVANGLAMGRARPERG